MPELSTTPNVLAFENEDYSSKDDICALRDEVRQLRRSLEEITAIQAPLLGIEQVAVYFGKSPDTIRRWIKDRVISYYKIPAKSGYAYLFSMRKLEEDLEDYEINRI